MHALSGGGGLNELQAHRSLEELMGDPSLAGRIAHVHSLGPEEVALPPLTIGSLLLERMAVREIPAAGLWRNSRYRSLAPAMFVLNGVVVYSSAGVLAIDDHVAAESVPDLTPNLTTFIAPQGGTVRLSPHRRADLDGVCLSLLAARGDNHYHWLMDGIARLGLVPDNYLQAAKTLLVPGNVGAPGRAMLDLLGLPEGLRIRLVDDDEALQVRTLVHPGAVADPSFRFHPCAAAIFRAAARRSPASSQALPRRIYVDRRRSPVRVLENESELISDLQSLGFVPIMVERYSVSEQIALFGHAETIVAPHGAGLANLLFAQRGCQVLELLPDSYVHWCYRHLAGLCGLRYDCVIGRTAGRWTDITAMQGLRWTISVMHVVAALQTAFALR